MAEPYTVRSEEDFEPTYTEDEMISIRKGDLRALLDICTGSMDYGSGFLDNEQVEALRATAVMLGIDAFTVTPGNFLDTYCPGHQMEVVVNWQRCVQVVESDGRAVVYSASTAAQGAPVWQGYPHFRCRVCGQTEDMGSVPVQTRPRTDDTPPPMVVSEWKGEAVDSSEPAL